MKAIATALVKAQKAFGPALKTSTNPHFKSKYADLSACVEAVIESLNDNGIMLMQQCHESESGVIVETLFIQESGETFSAGKLHVPASKQDPQGYGSALTYARRYSLMAACGIAPEEDDGEAARKAAAAAKAEANKNPPTAPKFNLTASLKWIKEAATPQEAITRARNAYEKAETDEDLKAIEELGKSYRKQETA